MEYHNADVNTVSVQINTHYDPTFKKKCGFFSFENICVCTVQRSSILPTYFPLYFPIQKLLTVNCLFFGLLVLPVSFECVASLQAFPPQFCTATCCHFFLQFLSIWQGLLCRMSHMFLSHTLQYTKACTHTRILAVVFQSQSLLLWQCCRSNLVVSLNWLNQDGRAYCISLVRFTVDLCTISDLLHQFNQSKLKSYIFLLWHTGYITRIIWFFEGISLCTYSKNRKIIYSLKLWNWTDKAFWICYGSRNAKLIPNYTFIMHQWTYIKEHTLWFPGKNHRNKIKTYINI